MFGMDNYMVVLDTILKKHLRGTCNVLVVPIV